MQTRKTFSWIKEEIIRFISVSLIIYIITRAPNPFQMRILFLHSRVMKIHEKRLAVLYVPIAIWRTNPWISRFHKRLKVKKKNGVVFKSGFLERINKLDPYFELFHATNKLEHSRNPLDRRIHIFYNPHSPLFLEQKQFA